MSKGIMLFIAVFTVPALADSTAGRCYTITNPDYRALCRAKAHHQPGYCYSIQQSDVRAQCLAETPRK